MGSLQKPFKIEAHQMLLVDRHRIWRIPTDMKAMDIKSRSIVEALVAGRSCGQILAGDGTLTDHDIFHALTEAPTSFWKKASARSARLLRSAPKARTPVIHRRD
jgi:hypothetical protein